MKAPKERQPVKTISSSTLMRVLAPILGVLFLLSLAWFVYANYRAGLNLGEAAGSAVLLAVPLALLYFSIGLLAAAGQQRRSQGQVGERLGRWIYLTPRIAGLLITLFVSLFALDVFGEGGSFWTMVGGFLIHAAPAITMGLLLALAWRRPAVGFFAFLLAALYFLRFAAADPSSAPGMLLLFSGPMAAIAMLFWVNWVWGKAG
jgi:hypothetical protein